MLVAGARQKVARKRSGFWLYFSYLFSLFLLSALIVGFGFILVRFVSSLENDSRLASFASGQGALAQDILNLSLQLVSNRDGDTQVIKNHLNLSHDTFVRHQAALKTRDSDFGLGGNNSEIVSGLFSEIEPFFQALIASARAMRAADPGDQLSLAAIRDMIAAENRFSAVMERIVAQYEQESRDKVVYAESLAIVIGGVILGVIFFEALFVFWPLSQRISRILFEAERFRLAVENASDAVVIFNKNGNAIYLNEALEHLAGYSEYELLGERLESQRFWGDLVDQEFWLGLWQRVFEKKEKFFGELSQKSKTGLIKDLKISFFPVMNKKFRVEFLVGILRDITEEKEIDRAKSEFVSLASHQLKSPLSKAKWLVEALLAGDFGKLNQDQIEQFEEVYASNQGMIDLVNGLLDVSRIELGVFKFDFQAIDINEIVKKVVAEQEVQIREKELKLNQSLANDLLGIRTDARLMKIVFQNLISNAVKYTPAKGSIGVMVEKKKSGEFFGDQEVSIDSLAISVKDTGVGIPEHQKDKIFSKLFRADNVKMTSTEGTGLGLYVVKSIVEKARGRVWFESRENQGTTFHILMPLSLENSGSID